MPAHKKTHCIRGHELSNSNLDGKGKCILCRRLRVYRYRANDPIRHRSNCRRANLKRIGWTPESVAAATTEQRNRCAICKVEFYGIRGWNALSPDHEHGKPPKPRELLCGGCNAAIGFLRESPEACRAAHDYLKKWKT
jgi:hypothetical protein